MNKKVWVILKSSQTLKTFNETESESVLLKYLTWDNTPI
jgi:hypothetical protein